MLDQSFSPENFRRIIDIENRKGNYLEGRFFPEVAQLNKEIKSKLKDLREPQGETNRDEFLALKAERKDQLAALESEKENKLMAELSAISKTITSNRFHISLKENGKLKGKTIYSIEDDPESYFALKQLQYNFRKLYKVKQASRYSIISHLKGLLSDKFPKFIVRTDLKSFYESIPHDKLKQKLNSDNLLTFYSKRIISQVLSGYKHLSNEEHGLPRGIGISAYLAEFYMKEADTRFRSMEDVCYYARYVDDFILVFIPTAKMSSDIYLQRIDDVIENEYFLERNKDQKKTQTAAVGERNDESHMISYLGYSIRFGDGTITLNLLQKKVDIYKKRIVLAIDSYLNHSKVNEKSARKLLVNRVRYLTGNIRLHNNKSNILVGVYFSNSLISSLSVFKSLDKYLKKQIQDRIESESLKIRIGKYSFEDGFNSKRFSKFTTVELAKMLRIWRTK